MKAFLRTLIHAAVSAATVAAAGAVQSGGPINSRNVLVPAIVAGALGAAHAAFPSTLGKDEKNESPAGPPAQ